MKPITFGKFKLNTDPIQVNLYGQPYNIDLFAVGYSHGGTCVEAKVGPGLPDCIVGEPFGKMTFWDERITPTLPPESFCVKTWSENAWVPSLINSGLFEDTGEKIPMPFENSASIWRFSPAVLLMIEKKQEEAIKGN